MRNTDVYSIELFRRLAEAGSLARAAEQVHLDPTALSRRISQLEHALGARLVIRSRKGTSLTPSGRRLYERSLELERLLVSIANDISGHNEQLHGEIMLAVNPSAMLSFAPAFMAHMRRIIPNLRLGFVEATSPQVVELVAKNAVDIGVGSTTPLAAGVHRTELLEDRLTFILPPAHPLAKKEALHFVDTLKHPYVICQTGAGIDMVLFQEARMLGKVFPETITVHSYDSVLKLVEAGIAISIVPQLAMRGFPGNLRVAQRPLQEEWAKRNLWMYSAWSRPPDALTRVVSQEMVRYCHEVYSKIKDSART